MSKASAAKMGTDGILGALDYTKFAEDPLCAPIADDGVDDDSDIHQRSLQSNEGNGSSSVGSDFDETRIPARDIV